MKTKIFITLITALIMSACSSSYLARNSNDDLYYVPGSSKSKDQNQNFGQSEPQKSAQRTEAAPAQKSDQELTNYERYRKSLENGETADTAVNPIAGQEYASNDVNQEANEKEPAVKSEEYYGEGGGDTYVDNYYYASRINRFNGGFYDPFFYDPFYYNSFYDPWYSSGWGLSIGFGWGGSFFNSWYSPFWGGYGYYGYNPYYRGYYSGYYDGGYYGGGHHGGFDHYPYRFGSGSYSNNGVYRGVNLRSDNNNSVRTYSTQAVGSRGMTSSRGASGVATRRYDVNAAAGRNNSSRPVYTRRMENGNANGARTENGGVSRNPNVQGTSDRRTYTPSYSKPRTYSRPSYNESSSGVYSESSRRSSPTSSTTTSAPSRSYNNGSSYSGSTSSGRTYSSGSTSSGSSYSGGSSAGSTRSSGSSGGGSRASSGGGRR